MPDEIQLDPKHHINLRNGQFDGTSSADLTALFQNFAADAHKDHLVVHFHGGLNSKKVGLEAAKFLGENCYSSRAYPVFFIWESGLLEILRNNLGEIFDEKVFKRLLALVTQFALAKLNKGAGDRGGRLELPSELEVQARLMQPDLTLKGEVEPFCEKNAQSLPLEEHLEQQEKDQFAEALQDDFVLQEEAERIANSMQSTEEMAMQNVATRGARVQGSTQTLMSPDVLQEIRRESPGVEERGLFTTGRIIAGGVRILERVVLRCARNRDHGLYPTIVEEILRELYLANAGEKIWSLMKQDTADAFGDDVALYGGTAFLEDLNAHWASGAQPRITLVGHSTGAHYICHFLRHAHERLPAEVKFDVVLLAPACDFRLLQETLQNYGDRIAGIRVFGMKDELERKDALINQLPHAYPRSLLYFVSGLLENEADKPLVGMQKFYLGGAPYNASAYPEIAAVNRYLSAKPNQVVWSSVNGGNGLASESADHGDFDNDTATLKSLGYILDNGF